VKPQTISAIHDFSLEARDILEKEVSEQLEGIYGLLPDGKLEPAQKYPALERLPEARETRKRLEQFLEDEQAAGLNPGEAREKIVREAAFTWLNRLVAFKMMETRKLLRQTVSKGPQSNGFLMWLTEPGKEKEYAKNEQGDLPQNALGEGPRQEAYRHFILYQCGELAKEIRVLFDPENLVTRLFPRPRTLDKIIDLMNEKGLQEAWAPGNEETIGWVYQFFNEREKKEVFDRLYKKKQKIRREEIPAATELFTPNWIVTWLVQNSLGRYWMQMHPDSNLAEKLDYLVPLAGEIPVIPLKKAKEIKFLDPACGTMHFGLVAFDLFVEMYHEEREKAGREGWPAEPSILKDEDIPATIIANNIHGLDIDLRAVQLSAMTLFLKAKSLNKNARITESHLACADVTHFDESKLVTFLGELKLTDSIYERILKGIWKELGNLADAGSLLRFEGKLKTLVAEEKRKFRREQKIPHLAGFSPEQFETEAGEAEFWEIIEAQIVQALHFFVKDQAEQGRDESFFSGEVVKGFEVLDIMTRRFDVVATNPPYMANRNMHSALSEFLADQYPNTKGDLYAAFIERCAEFLEKNGRLAMITQQSFMFISTYENMRVALLNQQAIETMCHVGPRAFSAISGEKVNTTLFAIRKETEPRIRKESTGIYFRLVKEPDEESKRRRLEEALARIRDRKPDFLVFNYKQVEFDAIPDSPWVYWLRPAVRAIFTKFKPLGNYEPVKEGINTGDNERFVRFWWEVASLLGFNESAKYVPFCKGAPERKYYDRFDECILNDLSQMRPLRGSAMRNIEFSFKPAIAFLSNTSRGFRARYVPGFSRFCSTGGRAVFPIKIPIYSLLGILNSDLSDYLLKLINPTISIKVGDLSNLPMITRDIDSIGELTNETVSHQIKATKESEMSFEFIEPPNWSEGLDSFLSRDAQLKDLERRINYEVYRLYGIGEEEKTAVEAEMTSKELIGLESDEVNENQDEESLTQQRSSTFSVDVLARQWISYAVGMVMGRFVPGVENGLGRGNFTDEIAAKLRVLADADSILVMDERHADDLPAKVFQALNVMVGEETAAEIVKAATEREGSVEDLLRQYLDKQFFKLHIQLYRKRPVYWFLQSTKKKYGIWVFHEKLNKDSLFRIRKEYVEPKINLLESRIKELQGKRDGAEGRERRALEKEIGKLVEILDDVREFLKRLNFIIEERGYLPHIDDGVLLNMAPLWELIPSWQAEPKKAWEALERGDYDWAYQAMDHWPDRVKEKCKTNKSFAIAHGLA